MAEKKWPDVFHQGGPKPTRQQIVDAITAHGLPFDRTYAAIIADMLVKAGYAEEPRAMGIYPVKVPTLLGTHDLFHVALWDGQDWWAVERGRRLLTPSVVGERITPPEEK